MANILVAEDDLHILRVVSLWLERNGHRVLTARGGREALDLLRAGGVDFMVTDINMPGMSGVELLDTAVKEGLLPRGALVLTSRCDQHEIAEAVRWLGGVVHPKPFSPSRLLGVIEQKLSSAGPSTGEQARQGDSAARRKPGLAVGGVRVKAGTPPAPLGSQ